jgi:hypothetical protein
MMLLYFAFCITSISAMARESAVFNSDDFTNLKFLEGRWEGTGPDGANFYEQYTFESPRLMRSTRFKDSSFSEPVDGSSVELVDGRIVSRWNEFSWEASELVAGRACFSPVQAPSSFCWELVAESTVHVTQRWTAEDGSPKEHVVPMRRL